MWIYAKDKKKRKCRRCGRKEFLWGIEKNWDNRYEDWRLTSN